MIGQLTFPVILKPRISSIESFSHDLFIIQDKENIWKVLSDPEFAYLLNDTIVVQNYLINSFEAIIKVYAIGPHFDYNIKRAFPKQWIRGELAKQGYAMIGQKTKFPENWECDIPILREDQLPDIQLLIDFFTN